MFCARAKAAERERIVRIVETMAELPGEPTQAEMERMDEIGPVDCCKAAVRLTKKSIIERIRGTR